MQAPLENGALSGFPIKGCAFSKWVREILASSLDGLGRGLTGHSAKCTALSWMSKLNRSELSRCILGHHVPKGSTAVLTHSRDEQSGPLRELASAYADIRAGRFVPDSTRSGMLCAPAVSAKPVEAAADRWCEAARDDISQQDIEDLLRTAQGSVCEKPVEPAQSPTVQCGGRSGRGLAAQTPQTARVLMMLWGIVKNPCCRCQRMQTTRAARINMCGRTHSISCQKVLLRAGLCAAV